MKKLRKTKLFALVAFLPLLTACGEQYKYETGMLGSETFDVMLTGFRLWILEGINSITALLSVFFEELLSKNFVEVTMATMKSLSGIGGLMNVIAVVGACLCLVRFAMLIFNEYFANANTDYAPAPIDILKRVMQSLCLIFIAPYLVVSCFMASTMIGASIGNALTESSPVVTAMHSYANMSENKISYSTYCYDAQKNAGVKNLNGLNTDPTKGGVKLLTREGSANMVKPKGYTGSVYDYYCSDNTLVIYQKYLTDQALSTTLITNIDKIPLVNVALPAVAQGFLSIVLMLMSGIVIIFSSWAMVKRTVDIFLLIITSVWSISANVKDLSDAPLKSLLKDLGVLCLSQAMFAVYLGVFVTYGLPNLRENFFVTLALALVILSTPTAAKRLIAETGAVGDVSRAGKTAAGIAGKFFGH